MELRISPEAEHDVGVEQGPKRLSGSAPRVSGSPPETLLARRLVLCHQSR
jgi:hypothetical protein